MNAIQRADLIRALEDEGLNRLSTPDGSGRSFEQVIDDGDLALIVPEIAKYGSGGTLCNNCPLYAEEGMP